MDGVACAARNCWTTRMCVTRNAPTAEKFFQSKKLQLGEITMKLQDPSNIARIHGNLWSIPTYSATISKIELDYFLKNFDTLAICNGKVRKIKFEKIQDNWYKVFSE